MPAGQSSDTSTGSTPAASRGVEYTAQAQRTSSGLDAAQARVDSLAARVGQAPCAARCPARPSGLEHGSLPNLSSRDSRPGPLARGHLRPAGSPAAAEPVPLPLPLLRAYYRPSCSLAASCLQLRRRATKKRRWARLSRVRPTGTACRISLTTFSRLKSGKISRPACRLVSVPRVRV